MLNAPVKRLEWSERLEARGPHIFTPKKIFFLNAKSIVENNPGFARVWLREKARLLDVLTKGDPGLMARARVVLAECENKLGGKG